MEIFQQEGEILEVGSNKPFLLDDDQAVWFVEKGAVNIFWVPVKGHEVVGSHNHIFKAQQGLLLFGIPPHEKEGLSLLGVGVSGTQIRKLPRSRLQEILKQETQEETFIGLIKSWIIGISQGLFEKIALPKDTLAINNEKELELEEGKTAASNKDLLWYQQQSGTLRFFDDSDITTQKSEVFLPLTKHLWFKAAEKSKLVFSDTSAIFKTDTEWKNLDAFHHFIFKEIEHEKFIASEYEKDRFQQKEQTNKQSVDHAFSELASVIENKHADTKFSAAGENELLNAAKIIGNYLNIQVIEHPDLKRNGYGKDALQKIARASRFRIRKVILQGKWWTQDNGPLFATLTEGNRSVALLPTSASSYEMIDPKDGSKKTVDKTVSDQLTGLAYSFYRPFPVEKMDLKKLLKFACRGLQKDFILIVITGVCIGLLGLITPLATGKIFNAYIPGAERMQLFQLAVALVIAAFATAAFTITRNIFIQRINGKMDATIQASIWDRLLDLPVPFFRDYSAGDLAQRALGVNMITAMLSITTVSSILGGVFGLFNVALLFYYSLKLGFVAIGLILISLVAFYFATRAQLKYQKPIATIEGKISGMVLQFISNGMAKLRVAAAEDRAFSKWAEPFSEQKRLSFKARLVTNWMAIFQSVYPLFCTFILFIFMAHWSFQSNAEGPMTSTLSTGSFLAFNNAFSNFMMSALVMGTSFISIIIIVPYYQRLKPILENLPEVDDAKADPGELSGNIEISHLNFRYSPDGPLILNDVSFEAKEGEFIALVGPSGSGKSTLTRLLLGFEKPESGSLFFDGQDLEGLDLHSVRRQIGVVLQNGKMLQGDIFTNIVGSAPLTMHDAWNAVRMAGLEADIKEMPMQLYTVVSEGGGSLSGGQCQRLMIARAIVHKPRILIFDEATSALDNQTQQVVSKSLESLKATRIVIAHRLSTIQHADRIYVIVNGVVKQSGNFDELVKQPGEFQELVKRQMA